MELAAEGATLVMGSLYENPFVLHSFDVLIIVPWSIPWRTNLLSVFMY